MGIEILVGAVILMRAVLKFYVTFPSMVQPARLQDQHRFLVDATQNAGLNCTEVNLYQGFLWC